MFTLIRNYRTLFMMSVANYAGGESPSGAQTPDALKLSIESKEFQAINNIAQEQIKDLDAAHVHFSEGKVIKKGAKGSVAKDLQEMLIYIGHKMTSVDGATDYGADGDFGGASKRATKAFQEANGLKPDGVIGGLTYIALLKKVNEKGTLTNSSISEERTDEAVREAEAENVDTEEIEVETEGSETEGSETENVDTEDEVVVSEDEGNNNESETTAIEGNEVATENDMSYWLNIKNNIPENGDAAKEVQEKILEELGSDSLGRWGADGDFGAKSKEALGIIISKLEQDAFKNSIDGLREEGYVVQKGDIIEYINGNEKKITVFDHIQQYFQNKGLTIVAYHEIQLFDPQTGETFDVPDGPFDKETQKIYKRDGKVIKTGPKVISRTAEGKILDNLNTRFSKGDLHATLRATANPKKNEGIAPLKRLQDTQAEPIEQADVLDGAKAVEVKYPGSDTIKEVIGKLLSQKTVRDFFESKDITPNIANWQEMTKYLYQESSETKIPLGDNFLIRCGTTIGVLNTEVILGQDPEVYYNGEPCGAAHLCKANIELPPIVVKPKPPVDTGTEGGSGSENETGTGTESGTENETGTESGTENESGSENETGSESGSENETGSESGSENEGSQSSDTGNSSGSSSSSSSSGGNGNASNTSSGRT